MRIKFKLESYISSTSAGDKDLGNAEWGYETTDAILEGSTRTYRIADDTENQTVDMSGLSEVNYMVLRTDKEITLRINGTESVTVSVPDDLDFGYMLLTTDGITELDVSNSSGQTATVIIQLCGELE